MPSFPSHLTIAEIATICSMFLAKTRREGEQILREVHGGGQAWTADGYLLKRYPYAILVSLA